MSLFIRKKKSPIQDEWPPRYIGSWAEESKPYLPKPSEFVDESWEEEEKQMVRAFLKAGHAVFHGRGFEWCRFRSGVITISTNYSDGFYVWPADFIHYIENHAVRPPKEFISHIRKKIGHSQERIERLKNREGDTMPVNHDWWKAQRGKNLQAQNSYLTPYDIEDLPYTVTSIPSPPGLVLINRDPSPTFQVIQAGTISSVMGGHKFILVSEQLASRILELYPDVKATPVTIFRKSTGEEWTGFMELEGVAYFENHQAHLIDHSLHKVWQKEGVLLVSHVLKEELEKLEIEDIEFEKRAL